MKRILISFTVAVLAAAQASAVETALWQIGSYDEFLKGTLRDLSLNQEGLLRLAPETRDVFNPDETLALSLATDENKNIFIGTGHQGKVFKVDASGKGSLFFTAREPEIFGMATGTDGALYVASSPEGKIYRITPDGQSTMFNDPSAKYIWALAFDAMGNLFAATGDQGKIFKIDASGKGEVFFDSQQTHIMCLGFDREGNLLAGSVPNGLVYRISAQGKAFVLYQSDHPEIHDVALDSEGRIYAAALGSTSGKGTPALFPAGGTAGTSPGSVTTVTVTASTDDSDETSRAQTPGQPGASPNAAQPTTKTPAFPTTRIPQGRGSLIVIRPDHTVETLWSSNSESVFGLAVRENQVLFSTDSNGRIFELDEAKEGPQVTLIAQTRESLATRLLLQGSDLYIATSNIAKLFRLTPGPGKQGTYESPVKDTKFVSKWGNLSWRADVPTGSTLEFYTRSGNSDRPDSTWSDWVGPYQRGEGDPIKSPPARFLQWKAVFKSNGDLGPKLSDVTASYLNQNLPPMVRTVNVVSSGERSGSSSSSPGSSGNITVTVGGPTAVAGSGGKKSTTTINWQAEDPNGDQMTYSVYVRGEDEQEWHLLKDDLRKTNFTIESNTLADGKYVARVVASDEPSNPSQWARQSELVSAPFWVDETPPVVTAVKTEVNPGGVEVRFHVHDAASIVRQAEVSVNGKDWVEVISDDGIVDSKAETFKLNPGKLGPGEHVILLRALDAAGNSGVGKALIRIAAGTEPSR